MLADALPWLQRFAGALVVVKYGGNAMVDDELKKAFAADMVFLRTVGLRPVVVHGGGPQISAMLKRVGMEGEFKAGLPGHHAGDDGRRPDGAGRSGWPGTGRADQQARPLRRRHVR